MKAYGLSVTKRKDRVSKPIVLPNGSGKSTNVK
jgi:ribosomal protein L1